MAVHSLSGLPSGLQLITVVRDCYRAFYCITIWNLMDSEQGEINFIRKLSKHGLNMRANTISLRRGMKGAN